MSCSRISRTGAGRCAALAGALALAALVTSPGCKSDSEPLTQAEVTLRFTSSTPGAATGATVLLDGRTITDSLVAPELRLVMDQGDHAVVVHKDCVEVTPSETLRVAVVAGEPMTVDFALRQLSGIQVLSSPEGLPVWLNGEPTGQVTPASLGCVPPGTHSVRVSPSGYGQTGFATQGDTIKSVVLGEGTESVRFDLTFVPRPQDRGVLFEIFTATFCPNCAPADHAASELDVDPAFDPEMLSIVQLHLWWAGTDPFFTDEIGARADYYRIEPSTSPHALFNGGDQVTGTFYPDLKETYRSKIQHTYGEPAKAGLYWTNARVEGNLIKGKLRFVAIEDLSGYGWPELIVFYAKDSVRITDPAQNPNNLEWIQGARDFLDPASLIEREAVAPGSFLDLDVSFDLDADPLPSFLDWSLGALRLVAFVQDGTSHEVIQCREVRLRRP